MRSPSKNRDSTAEIPAVRTISALHYAGRITGLTGGQLVTMSCTGQRACSGRASA